MAYGRSSWVRRSGNYRSGYIPIRSLLRTRATKYGSYAKRGKAKYVQKKCRSFVARTGVAKIPHTTKAGSFFEGLVTTIPANKVVTQYKKPDGAVVQRSWYKGSIAKIAKYYTKVHAAGLQMVFYGKEQEQVKALVRAYMLAKPQTASPLSQVTPSSVGVGGSSMDMI